jgi:multidrug efflux system membrane fusion protein
VETLQHVVTVPREAVNTGQDGSYIYVVPDGKRADMRRVKVLYQDQFMAAVSGIETGDTVVIDGQLRLTPGSPVDVVGTPQGGGNGVNAQAAGPEDAASLDAASRRGGG